LIVAPQIVDDRHGRASTIVTSQLPVDSWHDVIPDPTVADAVLDRVVHVHTAHRLTLKGESLRKPAAEGRPEKPARCGRLDTNGAE
jgi:DNA replication protein DnaC